MEKNKYQHEQHASHESHESHSGQNDHSTLAIVFMILIYIPGLIIFLVNRKNMTSQHQKTCTIIAIIFGVMYIAAIITSFTLFNKVGSIVDDLGSSLPASLISSLIA
ncbi:MAG: hypothetical protein LBV22_00380 [Mycoplasmataceae bacterium]|jgi:hypothetical protein|nr:hypothetical protein [Mycoplasmataceae bacterium]